MALLKAFISIKKIMECSHLLRNAVVEQNTAADVLKEVDEEIVKLQTEFNI
jgi:hypothetical protein